MTKTTHSAKYLTPWQHPHNPWTLKDAWLNKEAQEPQIQDGRQPSAKHNNNKQIWYTNSSFNLIHIFTLILYLFLSKDTSPMLQAPLTHSPRLIKDRPRSVPTPCAPMHMLDQHPSWLSWASVLFDPNLVVQLHMYHEHHPFQATYMTDTLWRPLLSNGWINSRKGGGRSAICY